MSELWKPFSLGCLSSETRLSDKSDHKGSKKAKAKDMKLRTWRSITVLRRQIGEGKKAKLSACLYRNGTCRTKANTKCSWTGCEPLGATLDRCTVPTARYLGPGRADKPQRRFHSGVVEVNGQWPGEQSYRGRSYLVQCSRPCAAHLRRGACPDI